MKEVKSKMQSDDELYVLMIAGLTDVLIKSVEEGKSESVIPVFYMFRSMSGIYVQKFH